MVKYSDSPKSTECWNRLEKITSADFVDAMKDLYSIYDSELVEWFARLYDVNTGGWYYSNSARDYDRIGDTSWLLRPDIESTVQALGFIGRSGMTGGRPYADFIPEWMKKDVGDYIYNSQDADGYFYHAHWGKSIPLTRKGRDLNWSRIILKALGRDMRYRSIVDDTKGSVAEKATVQAGIPEHLKSKDAFVRYLDSLELNAKSYPAGNALSAQFSQIRSCGLAEVCIKYLSERQNPETGLWHDCRSYYGINGLMKVASVFDEAGVVLPNAENAALSAIDAICSDEPISAVTDLWNIWVAIRYILTGIRKNGGSSGNIVADRIATKVRIVAADALRKTKQKILPFKKSDHAFSYCKDYPAPTSQGMPVCIPKLPEGDVNATVMSSTLMVENIFIALELSDYLVPIYGEDEAEWFLTILEAERQKYR